MKNLLSAASRDRLVALRVVAVLAAEERVENEARYRRVVGYESLTVAMQPR